MLAADPGVGGESTEKGAPGAIEGVVERPQVPPPQALARAEHFLELLGADPQLRQRRVDELGRLGRRRPEQADAEQLARWWTCGDEGSADRRTVR
jgi:hypothetical protein